LSTPREDAKSVLSSDTETEACVGLGAMACVKILESEAQGGVTVKAGYKATLHKDEATKTASYTTTWSYKTGTNPWSAGKSSDVFLVPSLEVKFKNIKEVKWDLVQCASMQEKMKFSLDAADNKPAITFLTRYAIDKNELPSLKKLREVALSNVTSLRCPATLPLTVTTPISDECKSALADRDSLETAISHWNSFLERHDNITKMAGLGQLNNTPYTWLKSIKNKSETAKGIDSHYSGLVPSKLAENAVSLKTGKKTENSTELSSINVIKFSGGESEFSFELHRSDTEANTGLLGKTLKLTLVLVCLSILN
jgi:hypothetical protein